MANNEVTTGRFTKEDLQRKISEAYSGEVLHC